MAKAGLGAAVRLGTGKTYRGGGVLTYRMALANKLWPENRRRSIHRHRVNGEMTPYRGRGVTAEPAATLESWLAAKGGAAADATGGGRNLYDDETVHSPGNSCG